MKVVVVGSGLSAVGALKALISSGIEPVVVDVGRRLEPDKEELKLRLSMSNPDAWSAEDIKSLSTNKSTKPITKVPKKLALGSDYFYSTDSQKAVGFKNFSESSPPYSLALGGFSSGWGGAYLPPAESELQEWPVTHETILMHMRECFKEIPCSEPVDEISKFFPPLSPEKSLVLGLTKGEKKLASRLKGATRTNSDSPELFGQARLLTRVKSSGTLKGCLNCGYCNAGCVYDAIYRAEIDIERMKSNRQIVYLGGLNVLTISESGSSVKITVLNLNDDKESVIECDLLFLAAGAVNSSRILLQSQKMTGREIEIKKTGGFIQPYASLSHYPVAWPNKNTQSTFFLEFQEPKVSKHWVHAQLSQPNELVLSKMGLDNARINSLHGKLAKFASGNLLVAMVNTHSDLGSKYIVRIGTNFVKGIAQIESKQVLHPNQKEITKLLTKRLSRILRRKNFLPLNFLRQESHSAVGYHFGASFPMRANPLAPTDSDELGRPFGWKHVHVVDTSVLPSIPGTTVGMLTMANAHRIASRAVL